MLGDRSQPEITISHQNNYSEPSSLAPLVEQEGEAYLEKSGALRRHTVANAHSDVQLLSASSRMLEEEGGAGGVRFLVGDDPIGPRQFSSQPDVT